MNDADPFASSGDPLIDEIRAIRKDISERFDNDISRLCEFLREQEKMHPELVAPPRTSGTHSEN